MTINKVGEDHEYDRNPWCILVFQQEHDQIPLKQFSE